MFPNLSNHLAYHQQLFLPIGLARYLRHHAGDFDVAHVHACRNSPGALAVHYLRRSGVPYVLAPNGTAPRIERRQLVKRAYDLLLGRQMLKEAARVLAVSESERLQLDVLGVASDAIRVIPNPVDLEEFRSPIPRGRFRQRIGLPSGPLVMFLGKLTPRKRVDVLIRAFAQLRHSSASLVIAGNDMGAGVSLRSLVHAVGLERRTVFTGLLTGHERLEALADADVVVYPSQDEIFGLVPLEALLAGTPVVVADDCGCGAIVHGTGGGRVVALGDVDALAGAIGCVLNAPASWQAAAAAAAIRIRAAYGHDHVCSEVEGLYLDLVRRCTTAGRSSIRQPQSAVLTGGVSFVVPVHNGAPWIRATLEAIRAQADGRPMEIIAVDDGGNDASSELLRQIAATWPMRVLAGEGRGAAAAINLGVRAAQFPIICQIDQDVVLGPDWLRRLLTDFDDPMVAATQGHYTSDPRATICARVMGLDLEQRYAAIRGRETTHVCTGNSAYRADALHRVGLFDESLGYGYDNDMSYRLLDAGYRLTFCRTARSAHRWREGLGSYLVQQYGFGYGRLDLIAKHPKRRAGDSVSPAMMMLHPVVMLMAVVGLMSSIPLALARGPWGPVTVGGAALVAFLGLERLAASIAAARRFGSLAPLFFPPLHLARDLAWVGAIAMWTARRLGRRSSHPRHSMRPRTAVAPATCPERRAHGPRFRNKSLPPRPDRPRVLGLIPAYNEAENLPAVVAEVRARFPHLDLLVIDDGSTDETASLLDHLDVRWLRFPARMGVGSAMRAGLRYAARLGYDTAVRIDGDGQHRAEDIDRLLAPIHQDGVDVVLGSRYTKPGFGHFGAARLIQRLLGVCISAQTGVRVTDPTSGFCALGVRAIHLLAEHHPTGYGEPELRLLLSRNDLDVIEVPVRARPRLRGTSSLTPGRITTAGARILLAMIVVPFRGAVGERAAP